jgi:hypothetical protein
MAYGYEGTKHLSESTKNIRKASRLKIRNALSRCNYSINIDTHPDLWIADNRKQFYAEAVDAALWEQTQKIPSTAVL